MVCSVELEMSALGVDLAHQEAPEEELLDDRHHRNQPEKKDAVDAYSDAFSAAVDWDGMLLYLERAARA